MKAWFEEHPLSAALVIWAANIVFVLAGSAVLSLLLPNVPGYGRGLSQSLILVLIGVLLVAALLAGSAGGVSPASHIRGSGGTYGCCGCRY